MWIKGKNRLKETKRKISKSLKIWWEENKESMEVKERNEKNKLAHLGKKASEETKKKMSLSSIGKKKSKEHIKKSVKTRKEKGWFKNSKKTRKKMSLSNKGQHRSPETEFKKGQLKEKTWEELYGIKKAKEMKKKLSKILTGKKNPYLTKRNLKNWKNEDYRKKMLSKRNLQKRLKGLFKRPTSFEQKIILLCSKYRLPFIYTGDGRILIGYKNPDFVDEKNKVIIEVFLNYFKERDFGSVENYIK